MTHRPGMAAALIPQRDTAGDEDSAGPLHRHHDGANGPRSENGIQYSHEYGSIAPEEPEGNPAAAGTQVKGVGNGAARGSVTRGRRRQRCGTVPGSAHF